MSEYMTPTTREFRRWVTERGISGADAAKWMHLASDRQARKYMGGVKPRPVSYPLFFSLAAHYLFEDCDDDIACGRLDEATDLADAACMCDHVTPWIVHFLVIAQHQFTDEMHDAIALEISAAFSA